MNIERKYCNQMLGYDIDRIIDVFGRKKNRNSRSFKLTLTISTNRCFINLLSLSDISNFIQVLHSEKHLNSLTAPFACQDSFNLISIVY